MYSNKPTAVDKPLSSDVLHKALTRPDLLSGVRLPTYPNLVTTATTQIAGEGDIEVTAAANGSYGLLFRDPTYPLWWATPGGCYGNVTDPTALVNCSYTATYQMMNEIPSAVDVQFSGETESMSAAYGGVVGSATASNPSVSGSIGFPFSQALANSGTRATAPLATFPMIDQQDIPFIFVPAGCTVSYVVWTNAPTGNTTTYTYNIGGCTVLVEEVLNGDKEANTTVTATNFQGNVAWATIKPVVNRWVRVRSVTFDSFFNPTPVATSFTYKTYCAVHVSNCGQTISATSAAASNGPSIVDGGSTDPTPLLLPVAFACCAPAMGFSVRSLAATLFTGVRLTMENISKIINREGTLSFGMLDNSTLDFFRSASSFSSTQAAIAALPAERRFRCASEHGLAASVFPGQVLQKLRESVISFGTAQTQGLTVPQMVFYPGDYAAAIQYLDPDNATSTAFTFRCNWTWEYMVSTQFVQCKVSGSSIDDLQKAVRMTYVKPIVSTFEKGASLAIAYNQQPPKSSVRKAPKPAAKKAQRKKQNNPERMWYNGGMKQGPAPKGKKAKKNGKRAP